MAGLSNGIFHATELDIAKQRQEAIDSISTRDYEKLERTLGILKKLQALYNDPDSDHSLTRQFELWGGSETPRNFSIPKANKLYNVVQTARESFHGLDSSMSEGMADLALKTRSFHADTPRWMYAWCPRQFRPYVEPWIKSVTRGLITGLDAIPILKPFTRWRQLRSFFSPVDAKYDMMARASSHCSDVFHREEALLVGELQSTILTSTPDFKRALVFEMHHKGLHLVKAIEEISPDNKVLYEKNLASGDANPPNDEIINGQKLAALNSCVEMLVHGPRDQGSTNRAGFISETTISFLHLPDALKAYKYGLKAILGQEGAYRDAIEDDLSRRNTLITGVPLNVAGIPTLVAIQKRMVHSMDAMIQKAQELRNATNPFEYLEPSAAEKDLKMRADRHFMRWRTIINYRRGMEAREHGYEPSVSKQMDALKGQNPYVIEAKPFDDREYFQKEAASYFLNVLAPIVRQIDIHHNAWIASKNDSAKEIRALQYYYTELAKHTAAIIAHSDAFNATGRGALPDDICRAFSLPPQSTCADMMQSISDKQMRPPSNQTQSRYWQFRVPTTEATNYNTLEPTMINHRNGHPYARGFRLDPITKTLVPHFAKDSERKKTSEDIKAEFEEDSAKYTQGINDQLSAVTKACKYNAGLLNSLFNIEWPSYIKAMRDVINENKGNGTSNWNGYTVSDTPIVYLPEAEIEMDNNYIRGLRSAHRKHPDHVNKSRLTEETERHRTAVATGVFEGALNNIRPRPHVEAYAEAGGRA